MKSPETESDSQSCKAIPYINREPYDCKRSSKSYHAFRSVTEIQQWDIDDRDQNIGSQRNDSLEYKILAR